MCLITGIIPFIQDYLDSDANGNGIPDVIEVKDTDGDGIPGKNCLKCPITCRI